MECSNTRNVVLMHPILTTGAVINERPWKWSCDKIKLRVHQGSKWSARTQILFCWCTQFWPQVLWKSAENKLRGDFRPLSNKNVQFWDHFFPALFPKDSESLKTFDIRLRGGKIGLKINVWKGDKQTNRQTHTQTDYSTTRLNWPSGPIQWKYRFLFQPPLSCMPFDMLFCFKKTYVKFFLLNCEQFMFIQKLYDLKS